MKHRMLAVLALVLASAPTFAATDPALPEAMVMVAPPLQSVASGEVVERLVHARFKRRENGITATLHFVGTRAAQQSTCQPDTPACLGNVSEPMALDLTETGTTQPSNATAEKAPASDRPADNPENDRADYREVQQLLAGSNLDIRQHDGTWTLTGAKGVATTWRPMTLRQASDAAYFVRTLRPSAFDIEQCVADQLAQAYTSANPTAAQTTLVDAVSVIAADARRHARNNPDRNSDAMAIAFAARLLSGSQDWPSDADAFVASPPLASYAESTGKRAVLHDNFERITNTARYLRRLTQFEATYQPRAQARIICHDLATLTP